MKAARKRVTAPKSAYEAPHVDGDVRDKLRAVIVELSTIRCAVVVTAGCLKHQAADLDGEASKMLVHLVSSPLSRQIEVLTRLAGVRQE